MDAKPAPLSLSFCRSNAVSRLGERRPQKHVKRPLREMSEERPDNPKRSKIVPKSILRCFGRSKAFRRRSGTQPGRPQDVLRCVPRPPRGIPEALRDRPETPWGRPRGAHGVSRNARQARLCRQTRFETGADRFLIHFRLVRASARSLRHAKNQGKIAVFAHQGFFRIARMCARQNIEK